MSKEITARSYGPFSCACYLIDVCDDKSKHDRVRRGASDFAATGSMRSLDTWGRSPHEANCGIVCDERTQRTESGELLVRTCSGRFVSDGRGGRRECGCVCSDCGRARV